MIQWAVFHHVISCECQLTTFVKGIQPQQLWWYNIGFVWCVSRWLRWTTCCLGFLLAFLILSVALQSQLCPYYIRLSLALSFTLMVEWMTGLRQERNVRLHRMGHSHKRLPSSRPCSELLNLFMITVTENAGWNHGCYLPQSSIQCVRFFFHGEWTEFCFQQHWSALALPPLWIWEGKWSTRPAEIDWPVLERCASTCLLTYLN